MCGKKAVRAFEHKRLHQLLICTHGAHSTGLSDTSQQFRQRVQKFDFEVLSMHLTVRSLGKSIYRQLELHVKLLRMERQKVCQIFPQRETPHQNVTLLNLHC